MTDKYDIIFDYYKKYIEDNSKYSARVVKNNKKASTYFPIITFQQSNNTGLDNNSLYNIDYYEAFYFTINIYTKNKGEGAKLVPAEVIDKELQTLTSEFFNKIDFKKTQNQTIPNIDDSIYRRVMQYQCEIGNRGNIIRR